VLAKILVLLIVVIIAIYFLYYNKTQKEPIHNEGKLTYDSDRSTLYEEIVDGEEESRASRASRPSRSSASTRSEGEESRESTRSSQSSRSLEQKMTTRDSAKDGEYKSSAYNIGKRGGKNGDNLDKFFAEGNPFGEVSGKGFTANTEGSGDLARYVPGKKKKLSVEDKFNADDLLPNENSKDWFDDVQATSVKNRHLINIYRPVGVNTISTSLKNPSHDVRGTPPNPRTFVSPWNMSSYEPDLNLKNGALCM